VFGIEESRRHADKLIDEAFTLLEPYGSAADGLKAIAQYLVKRTN
jgi:geranylgeranyl diphosphate synthase type II